MVKKFKPGHKAGSIINAAIRTTVSSEDDSFSGGAVRLPVVRRRIKAEVRNTPVVLRKNNRITELQVNNAQKDAQIASLVHLCDHRYGVIQQQEESLANLQTLITERTKELERIRKSRWWRFTGLGRRSIGIIKSLITGRSNCRLAPVSGLAPEVANQYQWRAINHDPQFILRPFQPSILKQKELTLTFTLETSLNSALLQLYFDVGYGFNATLSLDYKLINGRHELKVPVPAGCKAIRIDPVSEPCSFTFSNVYLSKHQSLKAQTPDNGKDVYNHLLGYGRSILPHIPANHLEPLRPGWWRSIDEDPHFHLDAKGLRKGWYMLSAQFSGEKTPYFSSKLYVNYGDGITEEFSKALHLKSGKLKKRVVYFRQKPKSLRLDPLDCEGVFSIDHFSFQALAPFYAHKLIKKKLTSLGIKSSNALEPDYEEYHARMALGEATNDYGAWIDAKETPLFSDISSIKRQIEAFDLKPLISVVIPTYNTSSELLRKCIDSVITQYYPHFEVCIADDCSPNSDVRKILAEYERKDSRVKVILRNRNGHISLASNSALSIATGELVALLDHDDELAPFALYEVVKAYNQNPDLNVIYSDEDKIDSFGNRFEPHFKGGWNPDLLYSQNYISHLGVYRRSVLEAVGGFRAGVEGSQDYDLLLRVIKLVNAEGIHHIPHVLYHWRAIEGSTALAADEKDYTTQAGIKALKDYFSEKPGIQIEKGMLPNTYRVKWPMPDLAPLVSLIIPTYNGYEITKQAIDSILEKTTYQNYEILLVDNNSDSQDALDYFQKIAQHEKVRVLRYPYPFNYSAINNFAAKQARGSILGLINNDVEVISADWLTEMVRQVSREDVGCVGAKLYYPNDTVQHAGVILGVGGVAGHSHKYSDAQEQGYFGRLKIIQNLSAVTAAALLVRKTVFIEVGQLNEKDLTIAFNDVDFCLRVKDAGYRNLWTPYAELYHHESISRGAEDNPEKVARFNREVEYMIKRWGEKLTDDFYSPNLTLKKEDFGIGV